MLQQQAQQQQVQQLVQLNGQEKQVQVPKNTLPPSIYLTGQHLLGSSPAFLHPPSYYSQVGTPMKYPIPPPGMVSLPATPNKVYAVQLDAKRRMQGVTPSPLNDTATDLRRRLELYNDAKRFKN